MKTKNVLKTITLGLALVSGSLLLTRCTKEGENASALDRSLTATDSTVFAQYYDSSVIKYADATPGINDIIRSQGVASIVQSRCATVNCHGGAVKPTLKSYGDVKSLVTPGSPEGSQLFQLITTNNFHKAMPPVYAGELTTTEKVIIYNWIKNGANEKPTTVEELRPTAIHLIGSGCASYGCHDEQTATGGWARGRYLTISASDTERVYVDGSYWAILNKSLSGQVWKAYSDSVNKFYADTTANASFRPFKTFTTPNGASSANRIANTRGPLNTYEDIIMDIKYPKNVRSNSTPQYTDPSTGKVYYVKNTYLNSNDCFIRRIDSTIIYTNPVTGAAQSANGSMAYRDGHWMPSEIAIVKAWYFADNNIPDVWKFGTATQPIFKYKSGKVITK